MHKDEWTADAQLHTEDGLQWTLKYYVRKTAPRHKRCVYGISVEKYAANGILTETARTPAFTASYAEAAGLAGRFAKGCVTPCVLVEMTDEWIGG